MSNVLPRAFHGPVHVPGHGQRCPGWTHPDTGKRLVGMDPYGRLQWACKGWAYFDNGAKLWHRWDRERSWLAKEWRAHYDRLERDGVKPDPHADPAHYLFGQELDCISYVMDKPLVDRYGIMRAVCWSDDMPHYVSETDLSIESGYDLDDLAESGYTIVTALQNEMWCPRDTPPNWIRLASYHVCPETDCHCMYDEMGHDTGEHDPDCPLCEGDGIIYAGEGNMAVVYAVPNADIPE